jgi:hypothetical protein
MRHTRIWSNIVGERLGYESANCPIKMPDQFGLQRVLDGSTGQRFILMIKGAGKVTECSKPLTEAHARSALHKMGNSVAAITALFDGARKVSSDVGLNS